MSKLITVTIPSGTAVSTSHDLRLPPYHSNGFYIYEIILPSAWTAAELTFQASIDGVTYQDIYSKEDDSEYVLSSTLVDVDRRIKIPPWDMLGGDFIRLRSGTSATPVNQAADRAIGLKVRAIE